MGLGVARTVVDGLLSSFASAPSMAEAEFQFSDPRPSRSQNVGERSTALRARLAMRSPRLLSGLVRIGKAPAHSLAVLGCPFLLSTFCFLLSVAVSFRKSVATARIIV